MNKITYRKEGDYLIPDLIMDNHARITILENMED